MEHEVEFPKEVEAIVEKHYVDDYLNSFDMEAETIKAALEGKEVHSRGGFEIRKWHYNSGALLRQVWEPRNIQPKVIRI